MCYESHLPSPHVQVHEDRDGFKQRRFSRIDLARNCLNAGLWELLLSMASLHPRWDLQTRTDIQGHKLCCRTGGIEDGCPQLMAPVPHEGEFISRDAEGIDAERVEMSEID